MTTVPVSTHVTLHLARFDQPVTLDPIDPGPTAGDPLA